MILRRTARRRAWLLLVLSAAAVVSACSVSGVAVGPNAASGGGATVTATASGNSVAASSIPGVPAVYTDLKPLTDAPQMTGKMVLNPKVKTLTQGAVVGISSDTTHFYFTPDAAKGLAAGDMFILPGIAARRVVSVGAESGGRVDVITNQPSLDDLFSDLNVTFHSDGGEAGIVGGDPIASAADTPLLQVDDAPANDAPPPPTLASSGGTTPTKTSGLRSPGAAFAPAKPAACKSAETSVAITVKGVTYTPSFASTPDCTGFTFGLDISGDANDKKTVSLGLSLKGAITISSIDGSITAGSSGSSSSTTFAIKANAGLSGQAQAKDKGGAVFAIKLSWDLIKDDFNFLLGEIPMVFRVGVPLIIEPRFSGGGDAVSGNFISFACDGKVTVASGVKPDLDVCKMNAAAVNIFNSIAPSAVVFAAGIKTGAGPGVAVKNEAVAFAGIYSVLTAAVGISTSGAAGSMLERCWRIDRSVGFNFGAEAVFSKKTISGQVQLAEKHGTNYVGDACPKSMTGG